MRRYVYTLLAVFFMFYSTDSMAQSQEKSKGMSKRERAAYRYYEMADSSYKSEEYIRAIEYSQKGYGLIKKIDKSPILYYELKIIESESLISTNNYESAILILSSLHNLDLPKYALATIYYNESYCYEQLKDYSNALLAAEEFINIIESWDDAEEIIISTRFSIARLYATLGKYEIAHDKYSDLLNEFKTSGDSKHYIECCYEICNNLCKVWFSNLLTEAISVILNDFKENYEINEDYCRVLMLKGTNAQMLGDFITAYDSYKEALDIYRSLSHKEYYQDYSVEAEILQSLGTIASRLKRYDEAHNYLDEADIVLRNHSVELYNYELNDRLLRKATILIDEGIHYDEAYQIYMQVLDSIDSSKENPEWLGTIYYNLGHILEKIKPDDALEAYNTALSYLGSNDSKGVVYAKVLNRIGTILNNREERLMAIQYYESAINIFRKQSDANNFSYVITLTNAAQCAYHIGELGRAIAWAEEARRVQNTTNTGIIDFEAWELLLNAYRKVNNYEAYVAIYEEYRQLSSNGQYDLNFVLEEVERLCNNGEIENAEKYIESIASVFPEIDLYQLIGIETYISKFEHYRFDTVIDAWMDGDNGFAANYLAKYLLECEEFGSAHALFKSAYDIYKLDPSYLANAYYASAVCEDKDQCEILLRSIVDTFRNQYKSVLGMSYSEKESYWGVMTYLKNMVGAFRQLIDANKELYDISLIYKNFLTNSDVNFLRFLKDTSDDKIKSKAIELQKTKELLTSKTHNYDKDSLHVRELQINRELILQLNNLRDFDFAPHLCCDSIAKALCPNEIAIEIADIGVVAGTYYIAMIIRKDWESPILIELGNENQYQELLQTDVTDLYNPVLPCSTKLYNMIWKPISKYLKPGDVIYISPSGIINTIAFEALSSEDQVYMSDKYKIVRMSSTGNILNKREESTYDTSTIFGGVLYDSNVNIEYSTSLAIGDTGYLLDRAMADQEIEYLPATRTEAEKIAELLSANKSTVSLYVGTDANEYVFKGLSRSDNKIIHIATHGFYIPREKIRSYQYYAENPSSLGMERSGLMLAGAIDAWNGRLTPGAEDGVLTAREITELDLSKTELVVLSACETGLGEITDDGIEGLQRAFKSAGVQTLIMSLWKVDDKATNLLMESFYRFLLKGHSKVKAFQMAKQELMGKKGYSSPYYWASFIMLD